MFLPRHGGTLDKDELTEALQTPTPTWMVAGRRGRAKDAPVSIPAWFSRQRAPGVAPGAVQPLAQGAARQELAHQPAVLRRLQHRACAADVDPVDALDPQCLSSGPSYARASDSLRRIMV